MTGVAGLPPWIVLDSVLQSWLAEDIGRGDRTAPGLHHLGRTLQQAQWVAKANGIIAGLPVAQRIFQLLEPDVEFEGQVAEGSPCQVGQVIAQVSGSSAALLMGERTALNLVMRLSGIATETRSYVQKIADLPSRFVDTRKTTPGLRVFEKYATQVGGATNHRYGLDDAVMIKDNHIVAAGSIKAAIQGIRDRMPYPITIEVETESLTQVEEALNYGADIIMLDNMSLEVMGEAVQLIRQSSDHIKIEASGNITLDTIRQVAEVGVDYISSSAPVTRSQWLDISMRMV